MKISRKQLKATILLLREQGWSYQRVADELDLDKSYVWRVANDKYKPHQRTKLADTPQPDLSELKVNRCSLIRGEIAEQEVIVKLRQLGFDVWIPCFTKHRCDIGILLGTRLVRIQIKLAGYSSSGNRFRCNLLTKTKGGHQRYRDDELDFFIVKCDGLDEYYILPVSVGNEAPYVALYPHRDKLTFRATDYELYRNQFELLREVDETWNVPD